MSESDLITSYDVDGSSVTRTRAQWRAWEARAVDAGWRFCSPINWDTVLSDEEAVKRPSIFPTRADLDFSTDLYRRVSRYGE